MAFNIVDFKARGLTLGGARPSLFQVHCTFPNISQRAGMEARQGGRFLISATQLPASIVQEVSVPYFGRMVKYKGDRVFQDWTVTVLNDEDFQLRDAFESWTNTMNYLESNIMGEEFIAQGYKQDMFVEQFAKHGQPGGGGAGGVEEGEVIRAYRMVGAWPTTVAPINLSWGAQNEIETFEVTFAYDYWIPEGPTTTMTEF